MPDTAFMDKVHGHFEALVGLAQDFSVGNKYLIERTVRVVCWHIKGPKVLPDFKAYCIGGHHEAANTGSATLMP